MVSLRHSSRGAKGGGFQDKLMKPCLYETFSEMFKIPIYTCSLSSIFENLTVMERSEVV